MRIRILDRYVGGQILGTTLFGVFVLCLVLVLGNIFKQVLPRLVDQTVTAGYFFRFILYVMPFSLVFTIPWGFLTAVLLVFGRLSADSELVSMRMAGISTARLSLPVLLIAVIFSTFCLWINVNIAPRAKTAIEEMFYNMATRNPESILTPDKVISAFPGDVIYFREMDGKKMKHVTVFETDVDHKVTKFVHAREGEMVADLQALKLSFKMNDLYLAAASNAGYTGDMTRVLAGKSEMPPYDLSKLRSRRLKAGALTNDELLDYLGGAKGVDLTQGQRNTFRAEISKRFSFSLACVTFCLVGIPLGVNAQRRETAAGFVISLIVASAYFLFIIIGDTFNTQSVLPHVLIWLPNVLFLGLGWWLFRRLNRK
jgi:lipopolysaccharide export system permease protein